MKRKTKTKKWPSSPEFCINCNPEWEINTDIEGVA
jgi:hypothetical protein